MLIIGVTGTIGAGKGTLADHLKKKGFRDFSVRRFLEREIAARGLSPDRDTMTWVANEIRREKGPGYIVRSLFDEAVAAGGDAVIESIRNPGEIETLKNTGFFKLIAVDADRRVRYERILKRGASTDHVSFEKFISDEERELTSDDPAAQNLIACARAADHVIHNNGSVEQFEAEIDSLLAEIRA